MLCGVVSFNFLPKTQQEVQGSPYKVRGVPLLTLPEHVSLLENFPPPLVLGSFLCFGYNDHQEK